jgi:hypothetical protein
MELGIDSLSKELYTVYLSDVVQQWNILKSYKELDLL